MSRATRIARSPIEGVDVVSAAARQPDGLISAERRESAAAAEARISAGYAELLCMWCHRKKARLWCSEECRRKHLEHEPAKRKKKDGDAEIPQEEEETQSGNHQAHG